MRIYLAAAWSRKDEMNGIAQELNRIPGVYVDSRWLSEEASEYGGQPILEVRRNRAQIDVSDVSDADVLVRLTDDLSAKMIPSCLATGARMFEMGLAYSLGKKIVVVGGYQPIFDYLPEIIHVKDVEELKVWISENNHE